ncbi:MAG: hypothetical protein JST46_12095 [Bacteroidetes bacterium]|nr:hypothetical protein [Bacteroidota bacterium]
MKTQTDNFLMRLIKCFRNRFLSQSCSFRNELFILNVMKSKVFRSLTLQDKITSLTRLIGLFVRDHGYMPIRPSNVLVKLNRELNAQVLKHFSID